MSAKTTEAPSLAERLESARQAEAAPRARVAEFQAALQAAEERRDWPEATRLGAELQPAREALGVLPASPARERAGCHGVHVTLVRERRRGAAWIFTALIRLRPAPGPYEPANLR
jgi:hypothetical protein